MRQQRTNNSKSTETNAQVVYVNPEIAEVMLKKNSINRKVSQRRVNEYAKFMTHGQWKLNGESICFDKEGNLLNGQHRLLAVIKSNTIIPFVVVKNVEEGSFTTYDSGKKRTTADVFGIIGVNDRMNMASCVQKCKMLMDNPDSLIINSKKQASITKDEYLDFYKSNAELFNKILSESDHIVNKLKLYRKSDVAATMAYLVLLKEYNINDVLHFFKMLFKYNTTTDTDYLSFIRDKIIQAGLRSMQLTPRYKQNLLFKAWNIYADNKDCKIVKTNENELVILK